MGSVPSDEFDEAVHVGVKDIAVDNARHPSIMQSRIKQSKTVLFRQGISLYVSKTGSHICPVASMMNYLQVRGMSPSGPLFQFSDGRVLTRKRFVDFVRAGLKADIDDRNYSGHSFRIGAATTAAKKGIEDAIIKTLGRWKSLAYLEYINQLYARCALRRMRVHVLKRERRLKAQAPLLLCYSRAHHTIVD